MWLLAIALLANGCATYRPEPLTETAVADALAPPSAAELRVRAAAIRHPLLRPVVLDPTDGLDPDEAALVAVLLNPTLRAERDRRGLAEAQLLKAGILPNPQLSYGTDFVTGGATADTFTALGFGASWELVALVTRPAQLDAARAELRSVDLDVAWSEWQAAQAARLALFRTAALEAELTAIHEATAALEQDAATLARAGAAHLVSVLDVVAADAAARDARIAALGLEQERDAQRLDLDRALGLPAGTRVEIASSTTLPSHVDVPAEKDLVEGLEQRRLDLVALRAGYQSEEAKVRAAVLAQFPKIGIGLNQARDTSNVWTTGFGISLDLPIFDRSQGAIAIERATRRQLFDEYTARVFEARADIAAALSDLRSLGAQVTAADATLPVLERLVATTRKAVDQGNADVIGFYSARNELIQKRIQALQLRQRLVEARIALEIASGLYLAQPETK